MADPVMTNLTALTITKVATGVQTGTIHLVSWQPDQYWYDYRQTTEAAPTNLNTAVQATDKTLEIQSATSIDVYIYCLQPATIVIAV